MDERYSRQILAFGAHGQEKLSRAKVGIVGLGGIGLQVVQNLAYMGVKDWVLIDDDIVEYSNLNRLVGATSQDAKQGLHKAEVAERLILGISPDSRLEKCKTNLRSEKAIDSLTGREYIFGCVDNDSARLILTELTSAFRIQLIDSAFEIKVESGQVKEFGGRVVIAIPGEFCLLCANQIDTDIAKIELESPPEKAFREKHGYGLGPEEPSPSVISLNAIMAGIASSEFLMLITGIRPHNKIVTYKGMRGVVTIRNEPKNDECIVCNYIAGKGDSVDMKRYLRSSIPKDIPK